MCNHLETPSFASHSPSHPKPVLRKIHFHRSSKPLFGEPSVSIRTGYFMQNYLPLTQQNAFYSHSHFLFSLENFAENLLSDKSKVNKDINKIKTTNQLFNIPLKTKKKN